MRTHSDHDNRLAPNLVRWGAVFGGTVISLGIFGLVSSLWLAIAYSDSDGSGWVSGNLAWFIAGTAVLALFTGGLLAGFLSGVRGAAAGLMNGMTAWGLLFVLSLLTVIPGLAQLTTQLGTGLADGTNTIGGSIGTSGGGVTAESAVWATFWSLLVGAVVAGLGGVLGGSVTREVEVARTDVRGDHDDAPVYPVDHEPTVVAPATPPGVPTASVSRDPGHRG